MVTLIRYISRENISGFIFLRVFKLLFWQSITLEVFDINFLSAV